MKRLVCAFLMFWIIGISLISCSKENDDPANNNNTEEVGQQQLLEIVAQVIRNSGLDFPEINTTQGRSAGRTLDFQLPPSEYVIIDNSNPEEISVKLYLGPDNHLIPDPDWVGAHPNFCSDQGKYIRPTTTMLKFTIFNIPRDGILEVQLNYIDVYTGIIKYSANIEWYDSSPGWMLEAMSEVWEEMRNQTTIKGAVEPCGDGIALTFYLHSVVTFETPETLTYEEIEVDFTFQFDEEQQTYTGNGDFVWLDGYLFIKAENTYSSYPPYEMGKLEVTKLIVPELGGSPEGYGPRIIFRAPKPSAPNYASMLFISFATFYPVMEVEANTVKYLIDDWETVDDPGVIMRKSISNTHTEEGGVLIENTIVEIRQ